MCNSAEKKITHVIEDLDLISVNGRLLNVIGKFPPELVKRLLDQFEFEFELQYYYLINLNLNYSIIFDNILYHAPKSCII